MIGYFLTRGLVLAFGYLYPAYECYKSVEMNKPDIEELRFWCQYWILVAGLTVCERLGDVFIGWVPMYGEAKLAFFVYLWFPKTKGATYVYGSFFRPYVAKHETEIDRSLLELRTRAGDMAISYWQKSATYAQSRIFGILQYIASQSPKLSNQPQPQPQPHEVTGVQELPAPLNRRLGPTKQPPVVQLSSASSSTSSSSSYNPEDETTEESTSSDISKPVQASSSSNGLKTIITQMEVEIAKSSSSNEEKVATKVDSSATESAPPLPPAIQDTVMQEPSGRFTRARLRRTQAATSSSLAKI